MHVMTGVLTLALIFRTSMSSRTKSKSLVMASLPVKVKSLVLALSLRIKLLVTYFLAVDARWMQKLSYTIELMKYEFSD